MSDPASRCIATLLTILICVLVTACGGSGGSGGDGSGTGTGAADVTANGSPPSSETLPTVNGSVDGNGNPIAGSNAGSAAAQSASAEPDRPTTQQDAERLLDQAAFGPTESQVSAVMQQGPRKYLLTQFAEPASRYTYTLPDNADRDRVHTSGLQNFCGQFSGSAQSNCWRDWYSTLPVQWDFFRQAVSNSDQLRQRVAFALGQIFVVSGLEVSGTYGLAEYHQMLRDNAFANFRTLLKKVILSPAMGSYLNMVDNDASAPNENFARELLQLFSLGTCLLNTDGSLAGGQCAPTYDNTIVRNYAYALSGWTYPAGGTNPWCSGCRDWRNPTYLRGDMMPVASRHDTNERTLLSGVRIAGGSSPQQALAAVLDSIMAHPNLAPFIGRQLIQHLVTSNPGSAYVARVSQAFNSGLYQSSGGVIGSGTRGDLQATLAAVLLDTEARDPGAAAAATYGRLRDPAHYVVAAIRALNGRTDGDRLGIWGGSSESMGQPIFNAPSVFNFYPPDFPLPGSTLVAPQFGISNANTAMARINFANDLVYWWYNKGQGLSPNPSLPNAIGTQVSYAPWEALLIDPDHDSAKVVDRLGELLTAGRLGATEKQAIATAMAQYGPADTWLTSTANASSWQRERVKTAAYLILSSPQYQIQR